VTAQNPAPTTAATTDTPQVETSLSTSAGTVPVDQTRVAEIRQAVLNGTYPVIPTKISDAMIAAGVLLQKAS
jgi:negative regulator of flagellin synthesis FlgM